MARFAGRADWATVAGVVTGGHFISHFYLLVFPPLFPSLAAAFDLSNAQLGLVVSAIAVTTMLQIPVGDLVDRIGAKRVFVAGVAVTALGVALVGLAPSYPFVLAFALLSGVGQSAFHPADYALLEAVADGRAEGRSFGLHTFGGYAGYAVAPAVVGAIAAVAGWRVALVAVGAAGIAYALVAAAVMAPVYLRRLDRGPAAAAAPEARDGLLAALTRPPVLVVFGLFVVLTMATVGVQTFTPVFVIQRYGVGEPVGGSVLTAYFALAAFGVLVGGPVADRYAPRRVIAALVGLAAVLTAAIAAGLAPGVTAATAAFAGLGLLNGLALPSRDRLASAVAAAGSTGRSFGFVFSAASLAQIVAPATLGYVIDVADAPAAFWFVGGLFAVSAVVALATGAVRVRAA